MNALQSYSSDENSGDEYKSKQTGRGAGGGGRDHDTNYDNIGMDISEGSGDECSSGSSSSAATKSSAGGGSASSSSSSRERKSTTAHQHSDNNSRSDRSGHYQHSNNSNSHRGTGSSKPALLATPPSSERLCHAKDVPRASRAPRTAAATATAADNDSDNAGTAQRKSKEEKQYSDLQARLLGLASGKAAADANAVVAQPAKRETTIRHGHDERRSGGRDDRRSKRSRSPAHRRRSSRSRSKDRRSRSKDMRSRSKDRKSKSKDRRSKSKDRRSKSKEGCQSKEKRSKSKERRSKSHDKRSRSKDRRSRSRDHRSRSRDRRDRRRRSRSRERRRDHKKDFSSKPGLLPLPTPAAAATAHPPPLLATPLVPALPAYYNPSSVNALKYAEQERKKRLLWGNKGTDNSSSAAGSMSALLQTPSTPVMTGITHTPPPALMALGRSNTQGRELNLGLGKNQFSAGPTSMVLSNKPIGPSLLGSKGAAEGAMLLQRPGASAGRELSLGLGKAQPSGGAQSAAGMADLWSTTTFNNDSDGKMAEKFKRLMGVKHASGTAPTEGARGSSAGEKLTEKQEDMFSNMERQYEVARLATHTHRGFGLGFTSMSYLPK